MLSKREAKTKLTRWSLRVAVAIVFLIVVVLFILFLVLFFFVRLCSNEDVGSHRPIRRV